MARRDRAPIPAGPLDGAPVPAAQLNGAPIPPAPLNVSSILFKMNLLLGIVTMNYADIMQTSERYQLQQICIGPQPPPICIGPQPPSLFESATHEFITKLSWAVSVASIIALMLFITELAINLGAWLRIRLMDDRHHNDTLLLIFLVNFILYILRFMMVFVNEEILMLFIWSVLLGVFLDWVKMVFIWSVLLCMFLYWRFHLF